MGQRKVDRFNPIVVLLALARVRKASDPMMGFDAKFFLDRMNKSAEHVQKHALAMVLQDLQNLHVDQGGEDDRLFPLNFPDVIDLSYRLVRLVDGVNEREPDMPRSQLELRKDGVAKGFSGDASPI